MTKESQRALLEIQQAQTAFKLAILRAYLAPMLAKVARFGKPIMLIDGFAGTGASGTDQGSTAIMLEHARRGRYDVPVKVRAVERDFDHYAKLEALTEAARQGGADALAWHGMIEDHLFSLLRQATGHALFLFLDPYGAQIPFDCLAGALATLRGNRYPPTEVLLNVSAPLIFREFGIVGDEWTPSKTKRADLALGGVWWHDVARRLDSTADRVREVTEGYARRLCSATGMTWQTVPVFRHPRHDVPIYNLLYVTRSSDHGLATFIDAVGRARPDYLVAVAGEGDLTLFGDSGDWARGEAKRQQTATQPHIEENLRKIAARGDEFHPLSIPQEVYGNATGVATGTQVERALRTLVEAGELCLVNKKGSKHIEGVYARATRG